MKPVWLYTNYKRDYYDGLGQRVTNFCRPAMQTREDLLKMTDELQGWETRLAEFMKKRGGKHDTLDVEAVYVAIDAAIRIIQAGAPFVRCWCVTAEKIKLENCNLCHGKRWLTMAQFMGHPEA